MFRDAQECSMFQVLSTPNFGCLTIDIWLIDQACGQDCWILAKFCFCVFMEQHRFEVHKQAKEEQGQYPAIAGEKVWTIKNILLSFRANFSRGRRRRLVPSGQVSSILPARVAINSARSGSSCKPTKVAI